MFSPELKALSEDIGKLLTSRQQVLTLAESGPGGGSASKPVGTVCFAWTSETFASKSKTYLFQGNREQIREQSVIALLMGLKDLLS